MVSISQCWNSVNQSQGNGKLLALCIVPSVKISLMRRPNRLRFHSRLPQRHNGWQHNYHVVYRNTVLLWTKVVALLPEKHRAAETWTFSFIDVTIRIVWQHWRSQAEHASAINYWHQRLFATPERHGIAKLDVLCLVRDRFSPPKSTETHGWACKTAKKGNCSVTHHPLTHHPNLTNEH